MANKKEDRTFDVKVLMDMSEPLTLYLERIAGSASETVPLPGLGRDRNLDLNATPGTGWSRDDVVKLVPWITHHWTGAGMYRVQIVDQQKKNMDWEFHIQQTDTVRHRPPPVLGPGIIPPSAVQQVPPPQQQQQMAPPGYMAPPAAQMAPASGQPWGQQHVLPMQQQSWPSQMPPPAPQQVWPPQQQVVQPPPGMWGGGAWGQPPAQPWGGGVGYPPGFMGGAYGPQPFGRHERDKDDKVEAELARMRDELNDSKRREIELKHQQEREREKAESDRKFDALKEEMRRANEARAGAENDEVRRAREDRERMERERERDENNRRFAELQATLAKLGESMANPRRSEDDERFRKLEEEQRRRDEEHKREMERRDLQAREERMRTEMKEQAARQEQMMRELKEESRKGPDPMIEYMKESTRQQLENQRQIAQMQAQTFQSMQASTINPMQLLTILEKRDSSGDQFIRNMMPALTGVIDLYRGAAENVVGLAGGGPAAAWQPIVEQAMGTGKEIMDRYFTWKRDESVSGNKAKIAHAQAQAYAAEAAVRTQAAVAAMRGQPAAAPQGAEFTTQSGHVGPQKNGANGAATPPASSQQAQAQPGVEQPSQGPQAIGQIIPMKKRPSEEEMFGKAIESIRRLRIGVKEGKLTPEKAIDAILQGVDYIAKNNEKNPPGTPGHLVVPVFSLYQEERWADFIDVVLPEAPAEFRAECVRILDEETEPAGGEEQAPQDPDLQA